MAGFGNAIVLLLMLRNRKVLARIAKRLNDLADDRVPMPASIHDFLRGL